MPVRGRGGRLIVVDERNAKTLSGAINTLPHPREAIQTQPMGLVDEPGRVSLSTRFLDGVDVWGLRIGAGFAALCVLALFVVGNLR